MDRFYMVMRDVEGNKDGLWMPKRRHETFDIALEEAKRLAEKERAPFIVLAAQIRIEPVVTTRLATEWLWDKAAVESEPETSEEPQPPSHIGAPTEAPTSAEETVPF